MGWTRGLGGRREGMTVADKGEKGLGGGLAKESTIFLSHW
jgi:hypothetical protein